MSEIMSCTVSTRAKQPTTVSTEILITHYMLFSVSSLVQLISENQSGNSFVVDKCAVPPHF